MSKLLTTLIGAVAFGIGLPAGIAAQQAPQQPSLQDRVAALTESMKQSAVNLRQYEWIETTIMSFKGEEKSRQQKRCAYGADGSLQKTPLGTPPEGKNPKGVRGKVAQNKKEEIGAYMQRVDSLIDLYLPLDPARIQASRAAGKAAAQMLEPGKRVRLDFRDYLLAGDMVSVEVDPTNNRLLGMSVATYLDKPDDKVGLQVRMAALADGTTYSAETTLDANAKDVKIVVQNGDHHKRGG